MNIQKITFNFSHNHFETVAWRDKSLIVGIDEVGRGSLAGPVLAAAVSLHPEKNHPLLKDSKSLSKKQLLQAYDWIVEHSWHATALFSHAFIDTYNIYETTKLAMSRAFTHLLLHLPQSPSFVVVDAMPLTDIPFHGDLFYFTKGESKSSSIAAASIIAKVTRDRLLEQLDLTFPSYGFAEHKGYATKIHQSVLNQKGRSFIHRRSFTCLAHEKENYENIQTSLFC